MVMSLWPRFVGPPCICSMASSKNHPVYIGRMGSVFRVYGRTWFVQRRTEENKDSESAERGDTVISGSGSQPISRRRFELPASERGKREHVIRTLVPPGYGCYAKCHRYDFNVN